MAAALATITRATFLDGDGEARALILAQDWAATSIGAPETWPATLKALIQVILGSTQPMFVVWGPGRSLIYNEPYSEVLANKHPAFGRDFLEVWEEIRADLAPLVARAYAGEATRMDDIELVMERKGYPERTHWAYSYTPVRGDDGLVGGFLCACLEITQQALTEQRQAFRLRLEDRFRGLAEPRAVMDTAVEELGRYLNASRVGYSEARADDRTIDFHACFADGVAPIFGSHQLDDFGPESIARQRRGETEVTADVRADPMQVQETWDAIDTRAFVSVPLVRDERFRASLYVNHRLPHHWTADEIALIEEVADRTWSAVERARAEGARDRAAVLTAAQGRVLELAVKAAPLHETLQAIVTAVEGLSTSGVLASILLLDPDGLHLRHGAAPSLPQPYNEAIDGIAVGPNVGSCGSAVHRNAPVFVSDIASDPLWADFRELALGHGLRACWSIPIRSATGSVQGTFAMYHREPREPQAADLELVDFVVRTAALVIERKLAEHQLRTSEERMRLATENAEVGFWDVDEVEQVLHWPPIVKAMFGISADVPVSMTDFFAGLHPEDAPATAEAYAAAADPLRRALYDVEYRAVGKEDGAIRWVAAKGRGVFDDSGRCVRITGTAVDITRRKAMEAQLLELNERLEQRVAETSADLDRVWRNAGDVIAVIDTAGLFRRVNPATVKLLGWTEDEMLGRSVFDFVHPDDVNATLGALEQARGEALPTFENRYRTKDGGVRKIAWVAAPEETLIYAYGRDVTVERAREAELELAQEALRQSQKMEAMGQLTGGVAHDFNNLLTPIVGALDVLQRKGLGGEREQRLIAGATQSADRAKTLVQRLLAFARRQPLQPIAVDIAQLIVGMGELVESTTGPQIRVVVEAANDLPSAQADPNQLEMALLNLSVNARDAMLEGGTLRITAVAETVRGNHRAKLRPGDYVRVSVADTGSGMSEATLARAVEPFFSTKGIGKGTGLGLSMVHGLASQLGGALTIQSRQGVGTNIELWLPVSAAPAEAARAAQQEPPATAQKGRVLLVDDEELVRLSTADMLNELGFAVTEASSAEEALQMIDREGSFDLVLTDHLMPGMTGTDLARAIQMTRKAIPVLLVSGYAEREGIDADLPRLTKPFRKDDLAASLAQFAAS